MKKVISIMVSSMFIICLVILFYLFFPVKQMPITNDNTICSIKDDVGLIVGYKLSNKEYYAYNSDYTYKYENDVSNPLDYNIHSFYLQFKKFPSNNPLYEKNMNR